MEISACPVCQSPEVNSVFSPHFRYGGRDLRVVSDKGDFLNQCRDCGIIFVIATNERKGKIRDIFADTAYATTTLPRHRVVNGPNASIAKRESMQADLFVREVRVKDPSVLDIGCFDGALLSEIGQRMQTRQLDGFDVNEAIRPNFGEARNRSFYTGRLEDVPGPYDLIVSSHSIQYIDDVNWLSSQLKRLLTPSGVFIAQVPNCENSLYSLFLGDKYYHYTPSSIFNVMGAMGFVPTLLDSPFPRDIVIAATSGDNVPLRRKTDFDLVDALQRVDAACDSLKKLAIDEQVYVLGTTIASTFVGTILGNALVGFVDENPDKAGTVYAGQRVIHPKDLMDDDILIVPFGSTAGKIVEKFGKIYKGKHLAA